MSFELVVVCSGEGVCCCSNNSGRKFLLWGNDEVTVVRMECECADDGEEYLP